MEDVKATTAATNKVIRKLAKEIVSYIDDDPYDFETLEKYEGDSFFVKLLTRVYKEMIKQGIDDNYADEIMMDGLTRIMKLLDITHITRG